MDKKLAGVKAVQRLSRLNRIHPGKQETFVLDFTNSTEEIKAALEPFHEESFATPTEPNVLSTMEHDLMAAHVLSVEETDGAVVAVAMLSEDVTRQPEIFRNLDPAVGCFGMLNDHDQELFRHTLPHFCRAYAFVAQVMPSRTPTWGGGSCTDACCCWSCRADKDPMPQLSKSVQLTHLRIAVTSDAAIALTASDESGEALPGAGKGPQADPVMDKLSAQVSPLS